MVGVLTRLVEEYPRQTGGHHLEVKTLRRLRMSTARTRARTRPAPYAHCPLEHPVGPATGKMCEIAAMLSPQSLRGLLHG